MRMLLLIALVMLIGVPALAQSTTAFDGTYAGVSAQANGDRGCIAPPAPRPLTIANGIAHFDAGLGGAKQFEGSVNAQGVLTMKDDKGRSLTGQVDNRGRITGIRFSGNNCTIDSVWQKQ